MMPVRLPSAKLPPAPPPTVCRRQLDSPPARNAAEHGPPGRCRVFSTWNAKEFAVSQNIISLVLTDAQIKAATDALTALEGALGGLIALDAAERRRLTKMGQKSEV